MLRNWAPKLLRQASKQHLAAIRQLFDYLVTGGVLVSTSAGSVRGPKYMVTRGRNYRTDDDHRPDDGDH